jgi:hypothetical protein
MSIMLRSNWVAFCGRLGDLMREQEKYELAAGEYRLTLVSSPGRRGALRGLEGSTARAWLKLN